jgi:hypothetical protein
MSHSPGTVTCSDHHGTALAVPLPLAVAVQVVSASGAACQVCNGSLSASALPLAVPMMIMGVHRDCQRSGNTLKCFMILKFTGKFKLQV